MKTRNVDITIANILDGIVTYTPEPNPPAAQAAGTSSVNAQPNTAKSSKTLGTSSFQEKKAKMIKEARERYIQKHGLKNC